MFLKSAVASALCKIIDITAAVMPSIHSKETAKEFCHAKKFNNISFGDKNTSASALWSNCQFDIVRRHSKVSTCDKFNCSSHSPHG